MHHVVHAQHRALFSMSPVSAAQLFVFGNTSMLHTSRIKKKKNHFLAQTNLNTAFTGIFIGTSILYKGYRLSIDNVDKHVVVGLVLYRAPQCVQNSIMDKSHRLSIGSVRHQLQRQIGQLEWFKLSRATASVVHVVCGKRAISSAAETCS